MELDQRLARYSAIEAYRKRPLLVYATSTRAGINIPGQPPIAMMAPDSVRELIDQIDEIPAEKTQIDILLHSYGGDPLAAWKLISVLRERFEWIGVLVPYSAFSAATLFALGADEIVMHPHASLGPIDPQILTQSVDGKVVQFSYEDLSALFRFLGREAKVTRQENTTDLIKKLFSTIDPVRIGASKRASELANDVGARVLMTHMRSRLDQRRAKRIAKRLNQSFFAHGDAVSRARAKEVGLKVAGADPKIEGLIWEAYLGIESHMELRSPWDFVQQFLAAHPNALTLPGPLVLPPNMPPNVVQQLITNIANAAMAAAQNPAQDVPYRWVCAVMESTRLASERVLTGIFTMARMPNGALSLSLTNTSSGWHGVPIAGLPAGAAPQAAVGQGPAQGGAV